MNLADAVLAFDRRYPGDADVPVEVPARVWARWIRMAHGDPMKPKRIKPSEVRIRDPLMVKVITGATKAGVHMDRKKKANKEACRKARRELDHG